MRGSLEELSPPIPLLGAWRPSKAFVSVASLGLNPSFQSRVVGVAHLFTNFANSPPPPCFPFASVPQKPWGVGQQEPPFPLMRGANLARSDTTPFRMEPEAGNFFKDGAKMTDRTSDVLKEDVSWSQLLDPLHEVVEEAAAGAADACSLPCAAEILAGEPTDDEVALQTGDAVTNVC